MTDLRLQLRWEIAALDAVVGCAPDDGHSIGEQVSLALDRQGRPHVAMTVHRPGQSELRTWLYEPAEP